MKTILILFINFTAILKADYEGYFRCSEDEIFDFCRDPYQPSCQTPTDLDYNFFYCEPGCVCKPGLVWDELSGTCVLLSQCAMCPQNEIQNCGGTECEPICQNHLTNFHCLYQNKKCICKTGFFRDLQLGKCVPEKKCPKRCKENEEWDTCTNPFCRRTCQNPYVTEYLNPMLCVAGCVCKMGYIWDEITKKCIHEERCPTNRCKENEEWTPCGNINCRITCQHRKPKDCSETCTPGCSCIEGFVWDEHYNKCVREENCSKVCRKNEEWCEFIPDDRPTCQSLYKPPNCQYHPLFVSFRPGCQCKDNFIWDEILDECVLPEDCYSDTIESESTEENKTVLTTQQVVTTKTSTECNTTEAITTKSFPTDSISTELTESGTAKTENGFTHGKTSDTTTSTHKHSWSTENKTVLTTQGVVMTKSSIECNTTEAITTKSFPTDSNSTELTESGTAKTENGFTHGESADTTISTHKHSWSTNAPSDATVVTKSKVPTAKTSEPTRAIEKASSSSTTSTPSATEDSKSKSTEIPSIKILVNESTERTSGISSTKATVSTSSFGTAGSSEGDTKVKTFTTGKNTLPQKSTQSETKFPSKSTTASAINDETKDSTYSNEISDTSTDTTNTEKDTFGVVQTDFADSSSIQQASKYAEELRVLSQPWTRSNSWLKKVYLELGRLPIILEK